LKPLKFLPYARLSNEFMEQYYPTESTETEDVNIQTEDSLIEENIEIQN
jgi:hypothetical protein